MRGGVGNVGKPGVAEVALDLLAFEAIVMDAGRVRVKFAIVEIEICDRKASTVVEETC